MASCENPKEVHHLTLETLYYGKVNVHFQTTNGKLVSFDASQCVQCKPSKESVEAIFARQKPQSGLGAEYSHLLIPAMPCLDIEMKQNENDKQNVTLPKELQLPLLKTTQLQSNIKFANAFASGIRSCIIQIESNENKESMESKWYRLKGCGNNGNGFIFACTEDGFSPNIEIRGCTFEHTSLRELYMTHQINNILMLNGFIAANYQTHGWYEYDIPNTFLNKIIRCCTVFETLGDKRLGDHLLSGLQLLLPNIIDETKIDFKKIYNWFPNIRKEETNDDKSECNEYNVMETYLAVTCELPLLYDNENKDDKINIEMPLIEKIGNNCKNLENLVCDNEIENSDETLLDLWYILCKEYDSIMVKLKKENIDYNSFVARIYYELGFEAGFIQQLLNKNKISWGTYNDRLGSHCNAHCNNYIILPKKHAICKYEKKNKLRLLAPLDFDMAYFEYEYIDQAMIEKINDNDIKPNKFMVEWKSEIMGMEKNGNKISLAGDPDISTGVKNHSLIKQQKRFKLPYLNSLLTWTLRDTICFGFEQGYEHTKSEKSGIFRQYKEFDCEKEILLIDLMYCLFSMSLILTSQTVA